MGLVTWVGTQSAEQLSHGAARGWVDGERRDFGERDEDESAGSKAGMGNFEVGLGDDLIAEEENVEVECARSVGEAGCAIAAEFTLDGEEVLEQGAGGEVGFDGNDGVEEAGLVGKAYRFCGVERGSSDEAAE
jgi:hypothetical protein